MFLHRFRKTISLTDILATAAFLLLFSRGAFADCSVTSGGGTVASPANGAEITCSVVGGDQSTTVGDSSDGVAASVILQSGATVNVAGNAINVDNLTLSLGAGSLVQTLGNSNTAILSSSGFGGAAVSQELVLADNARIVTSGDGSHGAYAIGFLQPGSQTVMLSGRNAQILTQGDNAKALWSFTANTSKNITLSGSGANITTQGVGSQAILMNGATGHLNLILAPNTSVVSAQNAAVAMSLTAPAASSTIDSAGLIQGGTNSIFLDDGDDNLTLRTGSNLSSVTGADLGAGTDTLTLVGNATEDEIFLNIENVEVNADAIGWTLTSTSTFDDFNVNTGLFKNNGTLTINNALTVDSGATFGGSGTTIGNVTNNGIIAPGNSVGAQVITGNFVQGSAGTLAIEFNNTGTDFLDISGTANIDGAVTFAEDAAGVAFNTPLTFLDAAGGITGTFSSVPDIVATSAGVAQVSVSVGATVASLTLTAGSGLDALSTSKASRDVVAGIDSSLGVDATNVVSIVNTIKESSDPESVMVSLAGAVIQGAVLDN